MLEVLRITPSWTKELMTLSVVLISFSQTLNMAELGVFFGEADALPSSVTSRFLFLGSTNSDDFRLQLLASKVYYCARLRYYFYLYHRWVKCHPLS